MGFKEREKPGEGGVVVKKQRRGLRGGQGRGVGVKGEAHITSPGTETGEEGLGEERTGKMSTGSRVREGRSGAGRGRADATGLVVYVYRGKQLRLQARGTASWGRGGEVRAPWVG